MEDLPFYYKVYVALHEDVGLQCVNLIVMKVIESVSPFERVPSVPFSNPHPNASNVVVGRFFYSIHAWHMRFELLYAIRLKTPHIQHPIDAAAFDICSSLNLRFCLMYAHRHTRYGVAGSTG